MASGVLFSGEVQSIVITLESMYLGAAFVTAYAFGVRKSYGLIGKKETPALLKYWVEFQNALIKGDMSTGKDALHDMPKLIEESYRQRNRVFVYAPMLFFSGCLSNALLLLATRELYWALFAAVFLAFGLGVLYDARSRFKRIQRLQRKLGV